MDSDPWKEDVYLIANEAELRGWRPAGGSLDFTMLRCICPNACSAVLCCWVVTSFFQQACVDAALQQSASVAKMSGRMHLSVGVPNALLRWRRRKTGRLNNGLSRFRLRPATAVEPASRMLNVLEISSFQKQEMFRPIQTVRSWKVHARRAGRGHA